MGMLIDEVATGHHGPFVGNRAGGAAFPEGCGIPGNEMEVCNGRGPNRPPYRQEGPCSGALSVRPNEIY